MVIGAFAKKISKAKAKEGDFLVDAVEGLCLGEFSPALMAHAACVEGGAR